jgi:hypothetical protein
MQAENTQMTRRVAQRRGDIGVRLNATPSRANLVSTAPDPAQLRAQAAELRWAAMEAAPELAPIYRAASIRCIELADALQRLEDSLLPAGPVFPQDRLPKDGRSRA